MFQKQVIKTYFLCLFALLLSCGTSTSEKTENNSTLDNSSIKKQETTKKEPSSSTTFTEEKSLSQNPKKEKMPPLDNKSKGILNQIIKLGNSKNYSDAFFAELKVFFDVEAINDYRYHELDDNTFFVMFWADIEGARIVYNVYKIYLLHPEKGIIAEDDFSVNEDSYKISVVGKNIVFIEDETLINDDPYDIEYTTRHHFFYLNEGKIKRLDKSDKPTLRLARNHLFAREGYQFKSQDLKDYFNQKGWYKPKFEKSSGLLDDLEERIVAGILKLEKEI